ncbi:MAG TPA: hypothetical protein VHZ95_12555, partial [Polyangiales bacterium]|nr:hypothetical protein [Polyangiales bacterium]
MSTDRTTIMILVPGRAALSIAAPRLPGRTLIGALMLPLMTGLVSERCFHGLGREVAVAASASLARLPLTAANAPPSTPAIDTTEAAATIEPDWNTPALALPSSAAAAFAVPPPSAAEAEPMMFASTSSSAVVSAPAIIHALATHHKGGPTDAELEQVPANGLLHLNALHLGEEVNVRPFDDLLRPIPDALAKIDHLLRCRVTGAEVTIDRSLIAILVRLHNVYGKA